MKLLITSVGSLLGQNILDIIESRRGIIEVIGLNTIADNPRNFRCDRVYLVHKTSSNEFINEFDEIIEKENPDFIMPGRDEDCVFLSRFKKRKVDNIVPFSDSEVSQVMFDKYKSYQFSKKHNLDFAETILFNGKQSEKELKEFIKEKGFPVVVKPREGFGSNSVWFCFNFDQLLHLSIDGELLIQEYLGKPEYIMKYKEAFKKGVPLFFQIPEEEQYAAQTIISPTGIIDEVFITKNTMVFGRAEYSVQIFDEDIDNLVQNFSLKLYEEGWYGPANFQLKRNKTGVWKVFELNPRLTGTSSGRLQLGYDEFGKLTDIFKPEFNIPNLSKTQKENALVIKYLQDNVLYYDFVEELKKNKVWRKS